MVELGRAGAASGSDYAAAAGSDCAAAAEAGKSPAVACIPGRRQPGYEEEKMVLKHLSFLEIKPLLAGNDDRALAQERAIL